ncbi:hypothetical protein [Pseudolysinimonas yzui]|uniref:Uncharacterized protein n=1 Tax=Pseudolysinimonas yzui TaxID=2708254 RepID=A0A8J3GPT4_9MICO|nr:hypothetical protein [Pseudolysinimonas yzui]GHF13081.1 hypothetical protein GCM10011600_12350 [Pseudolysinimonas yzui]
MNNALPLESSIRVSGLARRIRLALARRVFPPRRELSREELAQLREQHLLAERLLDGARTSAYTARLF